MGGILGLFLVRFIEPISSTSDGDTECWVVVGDLPTASFETEDAPEPWLALLLYCAICQDWADSVLAGRDLSECYPIGAAPTEEHATMLLSRIEFIRDELVPIAKAGGVAP